MGEIYFYRGGESLVTGWLRCEHDKPNVKEIFAASIMS